MNSQKQFEVFSEAVNLMRYICNGAAEGNAYGWDDEYRSEYIDGHFDDIRQKPPYDSHDFWEQVFALPEKMKLSLGFRILDENDMKMCIPIWIWQLLPDDMEFDGTRKKKLDNDNRFGCVWWTA